MARPHIKLKADELQALAAKDAAQVPAIIEELQHRKSRRARKLLASLSGEAPAPKAPKMAQCVPAPPKPRKPRKRNAKPVTPQVAKGAGGATPLGIPKGQKHRRNAKGQILSKAASAKLDASEKAQEDALDVAAAGPAKGNCKPCDGRGGFASGLLCRTCEGSGSVTLGQRVARWAYPKSGQEATAS